MAQGWLSTTDPDTKWWVEQLKLGEEFRKVCAHQDRWDEWRRYYRGDWAKGTLPVNVTFSMLRSMVPRVYFRNPAVSVTPAMPGLLNMAFAQIVHRMDNKLIRQMKMKREMKAQVQDAFMFGTAIGKLGWSSEVLSVPNRFNAEHVAAKDKRGWRLEYDNTVQPNHPWYRRIHPGNFIVPAGVWDLRESRWVGHEFYRMKEDLQDNKELMNTKELSGTNALKIRQPDGTMHYLEVVKCYEIRDMKSGKYILMADGTNGGVTLAHGDDPMLELGFPYFPIVFNPDDEFFWGIPDAKQIEPYQLELNENSTLRMKHRRMAIVKLLMRAGAIDPHELEKMLSEDVLPVVMTKGDPRNAIEKFQPGEVPQDLYQAEEAVLANMRETLGFSRNSAGEYMGGSEKPTAEEVRAVSSGGEIRVDERRDSVADALADTMEMSNRLCFEFWGPEQVIDCVGPGGVQIWVKYNPRDLKMGKYNVKVDPDTGSPNTRAMREAKAFVVYERLKMNPLIDPAALTRYLLTELDGVEMDELMKKLPPPEVGPGLNPLDPMNAEQYGGMIQNSIGRLSQMQIPAAAGGA